jgi:alpha-methylacyl-CoA racemase
MSEKTDAVRGGGPLAGPLAAPLAGPLAGLRIVEFAGIGPGPMTGMLLADLGAEVVNIARPVPADIGIARAPEFDITRRNRRNLVLDLKAPEGVACALDLAARADGLIEGFRPGVMERLGLGPETCHARNPGLVYGRVTGWGQDGPLAQQAGHDLNYIALAGALSAIGPAGGAPVPPVNFLGDYAGGGLMLAFGMVCALLERSRSGRGQVVDAAMSEGVTTLMASYFGLLAAGIQKPERGESLLDGGAPHYAVHACADDLWIAVAPIERKFRNRLLALMGFDPHSFPDLDDPRQWTEARRLMATRFREKPRAAWLTLFEGEDCCVSPVLDAAEAPHHPHFSARKSFVEIAGVTQPAPQPRFSRSTPATPRPADSSGADSRAVLADWGFAVARIESLITSGIIVDGGEAQRN